MAASRPPTGPADDAGDVRPVPPDGEVGPDATTRRLTDLHERWVGTVNSAVGRGAPQPVVEELAEDYTDEALAVLRDDPPGQPGP